jgi:hypothetical protein
MRRIIDQNTATLLPNGKVLIAGDGMAELYDPNTGTFASTGNMTAERFGHTATLLPDGRVLVAGGAHYGPNDPEHPLASAELYDPAAGTFTAAGTLTTARGFHTATLLPNGMVLLAGGVSDTSFEPVATAELYDPATGTFASIHNMTEERSSHTATSLPNGMVLLVGGSGDRTHTTPYHIVASAELYDPAAGTFTATGSMEKERCEHTATLLQNGGVLVVGGFSGYGWALARAELYDPATRTFSATGGMTVDRELHTATLLANGKVLIAGGQEDANTSASEVALASAELYDPAAGTFTLTGNMTSARVSHTATLLGNRKVLVVGGDVVGSLSTAELYQ